jgi:hypothetical protein
MSGQQFASATPGDLEQVGVLPADARDILAHFASPFIPPAVASKLAMFDQAHVLTWLRAGLLTLAQAQHLSKQLVDLDLARVRAAFQSTQTTQTSCHDVITPPDSWDSLSEFSTDETNRLELIGRAAIARGQVGVIILGGGQVCVTCATHAER